MFTGLIEAVGRVHGVTPTSSGARIDIETGLAGELTPGDSLAVNGVCLTVTTASGGRVTADIGPETMRVTTLGGLAAGHRLNLERPLRGDGRFGGHFVQGHVDAVGMVERVGEEGESRWLTIAFEEAICPYLIRKGSIAVDGISLTIARLEAATFDVMIIPFTWAHTNLGGRAAGDRVNLECDMVGKYVVRALERAEIGAVRPVSTN